MTYQTLGGIMTFAAALTETDSFLTDFLGNVSAVQHERHHLLKAKTQRAAK